MSIVSIQASQTTDAAAAAAADDKTIVEMAVTSLKALMECGSLRKADTSWSALLFRRSAYFLYTFRYLLDWRNKKYI